jgi:hypothetical protein
MAESPPGGSSLPDRGTDRLSFLKKAAVGGTVAWTAPQIVSIPSAAAQTQFAPFFVGGSTDSAGDFAGTVNPAVPPGVQTGDLLIAVVNVNTSGSVNAPVGWTQYGETFTTSSSGGLNPRNARARLFTKPYAGEADPYTFTRTSTVLVQTFRVTIEAYRRTSGIEVARFTAGDPPTITNVLSTTTHTSPAITTTDNRRWIVRLGWNGQINGATQQWGAISGATTVFNDNSGNDGSRGIVVGDFEQVAPGSTGTATAGTFNPFPTANGSRSITTTIALAPL